MVADDRPPYRMTFAARMDFSGSCDFDALQAALKLAVARHPLLTARLNRQHRQWSWLPGEREPQLRRWDSAQHPVHDPLEPIDLEAGHNARFWIQTIDGETHIYAELHHACCDGVSFLHFLGDWLAAYASLVDLAGRPPCWQPLQPLSLATRGDARWRAPPQPLSLRQSLSGLVREGSKWLLRRPVPLARTHSKATGSAIALGGHLYHTFDATQSRALRQAAKHQGVTLNDLILRDLYLVLAAWNNQRQPRRQGWLIINMPTNLRKSGDDVMPTANIIGYAFVTKHMAACHDADALLASIAQDTKAIRNWGLGMLFLDGLKFANKIPGVLPFFIRASSCMATAVFSNVGDPQRRMNPRLPRTNGRINVGGMTLRRIVATPPLRPGTHAAFFASHCGDELTLCVAYDQFALHCEDGQQLLDALVARLQQSTAANNKA